MIVRNEAGGTALLIGQTDHSKLVGQFAAHWGNDRFAVPRPFEHVARAAMFHDFGWLRYETSPILDAKTGETPGFRNIPTTPEQLDSYRWVVDWMTGIDRYAGLLVGMHRTGLWRGRYETIAHPTHLSRRDLSPPILAYIDRAEGVQEQERRNYDAEEVWTNYRLLQVWDLLGLYFCCQEPYEDHIEPVPTAYDGNRNSGVRIDLHVAGANKVALDPYPFATRPLKVQLGYRRMAERKFADLAAMRRGYFQAEMGLLEFELV